ncbi:MAG: permease [Anaerolineae bacterium]|nr:permease [Anaerolineae bacterium]
MQTSTTSSPLTQLVRDWLWIILALLIAGVLLAISISAGRDPGTVISIFATRFLGIFIEAAPFLLLGVMVSGMIDAFVTPDDIARLVPKNPVLATIAGAFLGFAFPVCECGVVPVVRKLFTKGLPMWVGVTFLLAAPVINPIVLASTFVAFGFSPVFIGRFLGTIAVSIAVGLVFALGARPQDVLRPVALMPLRGGDGTVPLTMPRRTLMMGLREALRSANREFFDMSRYLVIGTALAAAMQTFVPQDVLVALGRGPVISVVVMQVLAFVLSVCSTVDSFLALAFVGTFTSGSIITFLIFGPMIDIKSMLMFVGVFKRKTVLYLIVLPFLMSLIIGVWLNLNVAI